LTKSVLFRKKAGMSSYLIRTGLWLLFLSSGWFSLASASPLHPIKKNELPQALPKNPLIVVHATTDFDDEAIAAPGIDKVTAQFKRENRPVVYLVSDQSLSGYESWYTKDRAPDFEIFSEGGEHNLPLAMDEVTIIGGFFGSYDGARGCQTLATRDAIRMHFELSDRPFTVHMPLEGIYFYEDDAAIRESLLGMNSKTASKAAVSKLFHEFAELFFLTETWGPGIEFSHPYVGESNLSYRPGEPVNTDGYTFTLFLNDRSVSRFGHGPRKVALRLQNELHH